MRNDYGTVKNGSNGQAITNIGGGEIVHVLYVEAQNAKLVKTMLENEDLIHSDFRMTNKNHLGDPADPKFHNCIAIPILGETDSEQVVAFLSICCDGLVKGSGLQFCPYSSAFLGNGANRNSALRRKRLQEWRPTLVQTALFEDITDSKPIDNLWQHIRALPPQICPSKLEILGDDRTLVIPPKALDLCHDEMRALLSLAHNSDFLPLLWDKLATLHQSHRVVRRGIVDRNSHTRQSGYTILWTSPQFQSKISHRTDVGAPSTPGWITVTEQGIRQSFDLTRVMFSRGNISEKIRFGQTLVQPGDRVLDLYSGIGYFALPALVHGKAAYLLCCEWNQDALTALRYNLHDNGVADLATVWAGDCRQLFATKAANNNGNNIDADNKESSESLSLLRGTFDRVSLGLLPSSQGGWRTGLMALSRKKGGWLHIHGNVPACEVDQWALWISFTLRSYTICPKDYNEHEETFDWIILVAHVEKVKSFAPTINHYVADVFVGPREYYQPPNRPKATFVHKLKLTTGLTGVLHTDGTLILCPRRSDTSDDKSVASVAFVEAPSCALSKDGVLNQEWMRELENAFDDSQL